MNPRRAPHPRPAPARGADPRARTPRRGGSRDGPPPDDSGAAAGRRRLDAPDDDARTFDAVLDRWRAAYRSIEPAPDLVARVARAIRRPARPARRTTGSFVGAVLTACGLAFLLAGLAAPRPEGVGATAVAPLGTQGPRVGRSLAPEPVVTTAALVGPGADGRAVAGDADVRLRWLLASATALPRPDAAVRRAWLLASFDRDPRVREAAALLLAVAARGAPPTPAGGRLITDAAARPPRTPDAERRP